MSLDDYHFHLVSMTRPMTGEHQTPPHRHPFYEIGFLFGGRALWRLEGIGEVPLSSGQAILVAPGQEHSERNIPGGEGVIYAWLGLRAPEEALHGIERHVALALNGWEESLRGTMELLLMEQMNGTLDYEGRLRLQMADLLLQLRRARRGIPPPQPLSLARDDIEAARRYLHRNAEERLTIEQVARYHGLSLSHFEVLFRQRFGCSPKQYQHRVRHRRVEQSLRAGIRSPKELAARHGFSDAAYFCRWFRQQTGLTPSLYAARLSGKGEKPPE